MESIVNSMISILQNLANAHLNCGQLWLPAFGILQHSIAFTYELLSFVLVFFGLQKHLLIGPIQRI